MREGEKEGGKERKGKREGGGKGGRERKSERGKMNEG